MSNEQREVSIRQFKALVPVGNEVWTIDGLEYDGRLWLVPEWLDIRDEGLTTPARRILMDALPHHRVRGQDLVRFIVNCQIPKAVLEGRTQSTPEREFHVETEPRIAIRGGTGLQ